MVCLVLAPVHSPAKSSIRAPGSHAVSGMWRMRTLVPSSRRSFKIRFSPFDVLCAAAAPLLALYVRDALILSYEGAPMVALYCGISLLFSLMTFAIFRVSDGISQHFSVYNFVSILKAVVTAELMTSVVLFTFTRLEGIPRSTPLVHALLLFFGLILSPSHFFTFGSRSTNKSPRKPCCR